MSKKRDVEMINGVVQPPSDFESPEWKHFARMAKRDGLRIHDSEQDQAWEQYEQAMGNREENRGLLGWFRR